MAAKKKKKKQKAKPLIPEEIFPDPRAQLYPRVKLWPLTRRYGLLDQTLTGQCCEADKLDSILYWI